MSTTDVGISVAGKEAKAAAAVKGKQRGPVRETVEFVVSTLVALIAFHYFIGEARYIPSGSMEPTLTGGDRIFVEKLSSRFGRQVQRGDILVFYPPPRLMNRWPRHDWLTKLADLSGLSFLPYEKALIKRVVGLPGDEIRVMPNFGVFVNGHHLEESDYVKEPARYGLKHLDDIRGYNENHELVYPYPAHRFGRKHIIVPPGHYFMMGDNRNDSEDSHVWGFLNQDRVIGRACFVFWRPIGHPVYPVSQK
jgi:signal peptidase I